MIESTIATFGAALGLSLTYSLLPGPVTIEALRRGAAGGTRAVVSVRMGALGGSLAWAVAGLTGVGVAMQNPQCRTALSVAGSAILLLLVWRTLGRATPPDGGSRWEGARHGDALTGALLGTVNPLAAVFWLGVGGSMLGGTSAAERTATASAFVAGFILAHLLFTIALTAIVGWGRSIGGGRFVRVANVVAVAPLAWFALSPLIRAM